MKRVLTVIAVVLFFVSHAYAQKFAVELYGGLSKFKTSSINHWADFKNASAVSNRVYVFENNKALYGDYYTYSMTSSGKLDKIGSSMPVGINLRYYLGDRFSVSAGFRYAKKSVNSQVQSVAIINDFYQGNRTETRAIEGYNNSVRLLTFLGGIKWDFIKQNKLIVSVTVNGGLLKGKFKTSLKDKNSYIYTTGFSEDRVLLDADMSGTGNGYLLETGLRGEYKIGKFLCFFGEGGYSVQKISSVSGDIVQRQTRHNNDGTSYSYSYSYSGKWGEYKGTFTSGLPYKYYWPAGSGEGAGEFSPDLQECMSELELESVFNINCL